MAQRPQFSTDQQSFITRVYWETHSPNEVIHCFAQRFPNAPRTPTRGAIAYNVRKFDDHAW